MCFLTNSDVFPQQILHTFDRPPRFTRIAVQMLSDLVVADKPSVVGSLQFGHELASQLMHVGNGASVTVIVARSSY